MLQITAAAIARHYDCLNQIGRYGHDSQQGFDRPAYSDAESEAMRYIEDTAKRAGLLTRPDAAGNLIVETAGTFSRWVETGSHMDTVRGGGNYDGVAGVVAGLEVLLAVQSNKIPLTHGLRLRVWRGEESAAFGTASIGSLAAFGQLQPEVLERAHRGITLAEAMHRQGVDAEFVRQGIAAIPTAEKDTIAAYVELHIEQGNLLERQQCEIGVVTGIRGSIRHWVRLRGTFDHSGATPMGPEFRCDANLAMAHMMVALDDLQQQFNAGESHIVQTFGAINSHEAHNRRFPAIHENAVSKVSGFAYFSHEIRSCDAVMAADYQQQSQALMLEIAQTFQVAVEFELMSEASGIAALDASIQQASAIACQRLGKRFMFLASGAWHDTAVLSHQRKSDGSPMATGMIFIPCLAGISHSADEYASADQIAAGANVLAAVMLSL
ncbi:MAG: hypothetical protein CO186_12950 [Zetaproteobacteria bacterium CG_4_9_14_3_um_filter_49_83]|nr:MAG: hypothetical protein AUJ56_03110 [Zetaproteobacteria bacterium CG1_02_49_23]PIQ33177.1 MAG: hypothetical protein COW62_06165 [Zetaproteobacteria bacterium CG17_big_fil_post_rev_8_21_14_2_50_50_13]PIV29379.1 MAG: hypothetical protein COS35_12505 [Zetaproteobacteria bacterium CG02_land_8_20_14_3_00_50_9]PIY54813.1 MAG: hypothetical protein COZ00_12895 [Zetaproteobacteria bacterium CG_4_10_14_0_8_um_filter_49_80]PJA33658.1 MAG: hypothetical protein CO186_12950 [Zetaproteobacteria bacterium